MTPSELSRLALSAKPRGRKLKHWIEALPGLDLAAVTAARAEMTRIAAVRAERWARRPAPDPLIGAALSRRCRTPSARRAAMEADHRRRAEIEARVAREKSQIERDMAIRSTMVRAARVTRRAGHTVWASRDRDGHVSSYYIARPGGPAIRISDHEIPQSIRRDFMAAAHGRDFYDDYPGPEIIIDRPRSATWLRRAITLAMAGRAI